MAPVALGRAGWERGAFLPTALSTHLFTFVLSLRLPSASSHAYAAAGLVRPSRPRNGHTNTRYFCHKLMHVRDANQRFGPTANDSRPPGTDNPRFTYLNFVSSGDHPASTCLAQSLGTAAISSHVSFMWLLSMFSELPFHYHPFLWLSTHRASCTTRPSTPILFTMSPFILERANPWLTLDTKDVVILDTYLVFGPKSQLL